MPGGDLFSGIPSLTSTSGADAFTDTAFSTGFGSPFNVGGGSSSVFPVVAILALAWIAFRAMKGK